VVHYLSPLPVLLTRSRDGRNRIVVAPPHKHNVQVSYSLDDRDLVQIRGTSVLPDAEITHFDWIFWRGRYLLARQWYFGSDATIDLEYDDQETEGMLLLRRAEIHKGERAFEVALTYDRLEMGEPETPLKPEFVRRAPDRDR